MQAPWHLGQGKAVASHPLLVQVPSMSHTEVAIPWGSPIFCVLGRWAQGKGKFTSPPHWAVHFHFALGSANYVAGPMCQDLGQQQSSRGGGGRDTFFLLIPSLVCSGIRLQNFPLRDFINAAQISCLYSHNFSVLECLLASLIFQLLLIF